MPIILCILGRIKILCMCSACFLEPIAQIEDQKIQVNLC
jgi:hypothetical protein